MVETNDDQNGIVVHRSIGQRSGANQDPRSDRAVDASYFGGLWCGSSLATLGVKDIPNGGQQLYCGSSSSRSAVLDTTGDLAALSTN